MKIPLSSLSEDALAAIIETFVLREGTDYGPGEHDLASKCLAVRRQLERGEAEIDFDPNTETVDIRPVVR
ncbi:MAG TPA: YheU family protein [Pseudomonadales bacterium]